MAETLQELRPGQCGRVTGVTARRAMGQRLTELGFTRGSEVRCLYAAALGDPRAYLVKGAVIALRCEDARQVRCEREETAL